jgi:hypothetical protein
VTLAIFVLVGLLAFGTIGIGPAVGVSLFAATLSYWEGRRFAAWRRKKERSTRPPVQ